MVHRKIVRIDWEPAADCAALGGRAVLTLDCGHVKSVRASAAPLAKTRCPQCERLRAAMSLGRPVDDL